MLHFHYFTQLATIVSCLLHYPLVFPGLPPKLRYQCFLSITFFLSDLLPATNLIIATAVQKCPSRSDWHAALWRLINAPFSVNDTLTHFKKLLVYLWQVCSREEGRH